MTSIYDSDLQIGQRRSVTSTVNLLKAGVRRSFIAKTQVREQRPRSHHKSATGRVRTGNQRYPVLCHCQLGQDIPY